MEKINCTRCSQFFITWIQQAPYGCSAWGIKSRQHPHVAVFASSGIHCQLFTPRPVGNTPQSKRLR